MALRRTTVMVDEDDLRAVKSAAQREGRPESELIREAFHLVALRAQRWAVDWDVPVLDLGHEVTAEGVDSIVADSICSP
ncbi:ribbon-helix-helix protein, CopG family [Brevibacterium album]|uniref:ribbon-helix-helix protein, CopG family n=1 Tax=Brevibacterium album TaxID=417948 RepID=UPI00041CC627|nr:ribbon-helix-helix protein, CopG family [Brevibacterium album]